MKLRLLALLCFFCALPLQSIKIKVKAKNKQHQVVKNKSINAQADQKIIVREECSFNKLRSQYTNVALADSVDDEVPFVVVICAYNNAKWITKCLESVCKQKYKNYRVILIVDASTDKTAQLAHEFIDKHKLQNKFTLIVNKTRYWKLKNIYKAFHSCDDHEVIVQLDGDDWFAHDNVLKKLNTVFHDPDVWFSYGQMKFHPRGQQGYCRSIPHNVKVNAGFRKHPWVTSHVKAFYAWLFKAVKLQDLIAENVKDWKGKFYPYANDLATVFPMLDMARTRINFLSEVMYIYNSTNPLSGHKVGSGYSQKMSEVEVRKLPVYEGLDKPVMDRLAEFEGAEADVLIIADSQNSSFILNALATLHTYMHGMGKVCIFYDSLDNEIIQQFKEIEEVAPFVVCVNTSKNDWQEVITLLPNKHVIVTKANLVLDKPINITNSILDLERTFAHGIYFSLSPHICNKRKVPYQHIWDNLYAWKFKTDSMHFFDMKNCDFTLYRKKDITEYIFHNTDSEVGLSTLLQQMHVDQRKVGLFYADVKTKKCEFDAKQVSQSAHGE